MQTLQETSSTLATIQTLSTKVLREIGTYARRLARDDNDMVSNLLLEYSNLDREDAVKFVKDAIRLIASDANSVREQIGSFSKALASNKDIAANADKFPFMAEVWLGDSYDEPGLDGLKNLEGDLREQQRNVSYDLIYDKSKELIGEK